MDQSRFIARHVVNLPKSGTRDFFDIVARMKDAIAPGV
jgi:aminotransferase